MSAVNAQLRFFVPSSSGKEKRRTGTAFLGSKTVGGKKDTMMSKRESSCL